MRALLVTLQALTKPMAQFVIGTCVNAVLAVSALVGGLSCCLTVAVISPVLAYLMGIVPQILTVPAIIVGNAIYVVLLSVLADKTCKNLAKQAIAWVVAAAKFATPYLIVVKMICGVISENLLVAGTLKVPMLKTLPTTFSWPQLFTDLIGGAVAPAIVSVLRKALHK